jgi:hypothetical protein
MHGQVLGGFGAAFCRAGLDEHEQAGSWGVLSPKPTFSKTGNSD